MTKSKRIFTIVLAFVFLITSVAFTALVILQTTRDDQDPSSNELDSSDIEQLQNNQPQEGMLQGTQLEGFEPIEDVSELQVIDIEEGNGEEVQPGAGVTAHYTGAIASTGVIFQSSYDTGQAVPFSLDGVIEGWTEGVPGMKVGGKRRLVIPAAQAYGNQSPSPDVPANSDLVFDIEVLEVEQ
ncbi:MAG: FKBP-type peptidyl-prolyl cis-trans isomerase [Candidatus Saccharibacteria bacterium]|nr:FKBP-type peptidyl-prolyl cis-trans isomerase [Candidatus Saccharibacteria bacterium]